MLDALREVRRAVVEIVNDARRRDIFAVAIKGCDGALYVCHKDRFVFGGLSVAERRWREKDDVVAERVMLHVEPFARHDDYEIVKPSAIGRNRTYFVVWFAPPSFDPTALQWRGHLLSATETSAFSKGQYKAVAYIIERAERLHKIRQKPKEVSTEAAATTSVPEGQTQAA